MNESAGFDGRSTLRRVRLDLTFDAFAVVAGGPHQFVVQLKKEAEAGGVWVLRMVARAAFHNAGHG